MSHCPNDRGWLAHEAWIGALAAKIRPDGAELDLRRQGREPGQRRVNPRRFRTSDRRGHVLSRSGCSRCRVVVAGPRPRNHPDFPLRGFVRCETCGRPLTGSWSKGRNGHYAYYHCQRQCRAVNVTKAALEGAVVDELALLQPTPSQAEGACETSHEATSSFEFLRYDPKVKLVLLACGVVHRHCLVGLPVTHCEAV